MSSQTVIAKYMKNSDTEKNDQNSYLEQSLFCTKMFKKLESEKNIIQIRHAQEVQKQIAKFIVGKELTHHNRRYQITKITTKSCSSSLITTKCKFKPQ